MMKLLVIGSIGFDSIETPTGKIEKALGGTAVFCSVAASYFTQAGIVAAVGTDFPAPHVAFLQSRGVDLAGLQTLDGETFHWGARYHQDMNSRETMFTHLNVFNDFSPELPEAYRCAPFVFLGNIDPGLQLHVLEQMQRPQFVALDTMNYWINGTPEPLRQVLKKIDLLFVNDEEARMLSGDSNLLRAARAIHKTGPKIIVIKKGEHGALMVQGEELFFAPAFPLENVQDPTGAGDTFAGGFMGYLAGANRLDAVTLRRAMIYGSTLASFVVEDFSIDRLRHLRRVEISNRFRLFRKLTAFDDE